MGTRKITPRKTVPLKIAPNLTLTLALTLTQEGICWGDNLPGSNFPVT